jgi:hypothetical protein
VIFKQAIHKIKSEQSKEQWVLSVTDAALYMAAGGFINEANDVLSAVWQHRKPYDRTTWLADRAFEMLWYAAGKRPANVPFEQIGVDELEVAHRDYLVSPSGEYIPSIAVNDYIKAQLFCRSTEGKLPYKDMEKIALDIFLPYLHAPDFNPYTICKILSLVTELSAKHDKKEQAITILKQWGNKIGKHPYNAALVLIAANRHVAPLLLSGAITVELELNSQKCKAFVTEAIAAIGRRGEFDNLKLL